MSFKPFEADAEQTETISGEEGVAVYALKPDGMVLPQQVVIVPQHYYLNMLAEFVARLEAKGCDVFDENVDSGYSDRLIAEVIKEMQNDSHEH